MKGARRTKNIILGIIGILIAAYVLFPFYLVVMNSFKAQTSIVESPVSLAGASVAQLWENLTKVASNSNFNFWYAFGTSALITVISLVLLAVFGGMAAWVISRNNKKKWATAIYMVFIASMIIPFQVVMLPLISTFRDVGKFVGISMLQSIPFFRIIFPLLKPVITTVTILNGMWIWNDYLLPSLMLGQNGKVKTLPVAVQAFVGSYVKQWDLILTAALLAILPMIIIFMFAQKQIMSGMVEGAVK